MAKNVLVDSCYWIALYESDDQYHDSAILLDDYLAPHRIMIPWPSLYEFLNTRFARRPIRIDSFRKRILQPNIIKIPDTLYRDEAITNFFSRPKYGQSLSLVDLVMREILADNSVKIDAILTFNYRDFADMCAERRIDDFAS